MSEFDPAESSSPEMGEPIYFMGQKEIRRVPLTWQHPTYSVDELEPDQHYLLGRYKALQSRERYSEEEIEELSREGIFEFMPDFSDIPEEEMGICIYETVTDGTPKSEVFPDTPNGHLDLIRFAADRIEVIGAGYVSAEAWVAILGTGAVIDIANGRVTTNPS
jgi:hypothetical protein